MNYSRFGLDQQKITSDNNTYHNLLLIRSIMDLPKLTSQNAHHVMPAVVLGKAATELYNDSISEHTRRAYQGALDRLRAWAGGRMLTDALLADYLAELYEEGKSPATITVVLAMVRFVANEYGLDSPDGVENETSNERDTTQWKGQGSWSSCWHPMGTGGCCSFSVHISQK